MKKWLFVICALSFVFLFRSTLSNAAERIDGKSPVLTFYKGTQGDIDGPYPNFRVQVFEDGSAIYEGLSDVRLIGVHKYQLTPDEYRALIKVVEHTFAVSKSSFANKEFTFGYLVLATSARFDFTCQLSSTQARAGIP